MFLIAWAIIIAGIYFAFKKTIDFIFAPLKNQEFEFSKVDDTEIKNKPQEIIIKDNNIDTSKIINYEGKVGNTFSWYPKTFKQFIGQEEAKEQANIICAKIARNIKSHLLLSATQGHGKCHAKGTKILMYDGTYKKVEDIIPGNKVMGIDSKSRKVINVGKGYGNLYKIIPTKGNSFIVNHEHILSLKKSGTEETLNISVKDYLNSPTTIKLRHELYRIPVNFPKKEVPLDPYFLGLWLGDGSSDCSRITNSSPIIWNWLKKYAIKINLVFSFKKFGKKCPYMNISSGYVGRQCKDNTQKRLNQLNLLGNKHIPDIYKYNSRENRLKLLAGLIDSDGWLNKPNTYEITSKYNKLADDIKYTAQSLGFFCYIVPFYVKLKSWEKKKKYNRIRIIGDCNIIPVKLKYKKAKIRKINKNPLYSGFKIKKLKSKDFYYGFTLDGDHLYMIEDFIVNHNTTYIRLLASRINAHLIERVGKQINEDNIVDIINEINTSDKENVIFFLDEVDSADKTVIKILNPILQDFKINDKQIKPFTFACATINKDILIKNNPDTLDRIPHHIQFKRYTVEELSLILSQYIEQLYSNENITAEIVRRIAENCKFNPRLALGIMEDYIITKDMVKTLLNRRIVRNGLTDIDIKILETLNASKRPMGANSLAMRTGLTENQYIREFEPFLYYEGFINRTPSRIISDKGKQLLSEIK